MTESPQQKPHKPLSPGLLETFMERFELKKDEVLEQKDAFDLLDINSSGKISMQELREFNARSGCGFTEPELEEQFREMDLEGKGGITFLEYLKVYVKGSYGREVRLGREHDDQIVRDLQVTPRSRKSAVYFTSNHTGLDLGPIEEGRDAGVAENGSPRTEEAAQADAAPAEVAPATGALAEGALAEAALAEAAPADVALAEVAPAELAPAEA